MIPRRAALLAPALVLCARPAAAQSRILEARLRPREATVQLVLAAEADPAEVLRIRSRGPDAPTGEVVLPLGRAGLVPARLVWLAGREALVVEIPGLAGEGVAQRLAAVVAADNAGRLRVIGLETLDAQDRAGCESEARLNARIEAGDRGTLRLAVSFLRRPGACGERWRGVPQREAWTDVLRWTGQGALTAAPAPPVAGPVRHAFAAARTRLAALLAEPVEDLRAVPWEDSGIRELVLAGRG